MKNTIEKRPAGSEVTAQQGVDLGRWLGRHDAFAMIAGSCSAADVESLRRIRDAQHYRAVARNWDEFCSVHLRISRRKVEKNIRYLEEFGPQYFVLKQIVHITENEFRAIAPHVGTEGLHTANGVVALLPEKSEQVAAAVAGLLREKEKVAEPAAPPEADGSGDPSFQPILRHCETAGRLLDAYDQELQAVDRVELTAALMRLWRLAGHQCVTLD
jgi:hypothetical protein